MGANDHSPVRKIFRIVNRHYTVLPQKRHDLRVVDQWAQSMYAVLTCFRPGSTSESTIHRQIERSSHSHTEPCFPSQSDRHIAPVPIATQPTNTSQSTTYTSSSNGIALSTPCQQQTSCRANTSHEFDDVDHPLGEMIYLLRTIQDISADEMRVMPLLDLEDKYYTIGEVSTLLDIKPHVLHFWERQFPQLRPVRGPNNRRRYRLNEIGVIEQIKELLWVERYTIEGARQRLQDKPRGSYRPSSTAAMRQLVKEIETGIYDALDIIGSDNHRD